jgi:hypothetical protein
LTARTGNKRQKIENTNKAPDQDDHDVDMPGNSPTTPQLQSLQATVRHWFATAEAAASPVKAVAGNASDYSSWSVQQLMKLYYGM